MTGNDEHPNYLWFGDIWGMVYYCCTHITISLQCNIVYLSKTCPWHMCSPASQMDTFSLRPRMHQSRHKYGAVGVISVTFGPWDSWGFSGDDPPPSCGHFRRNMRKKENKHMELWGTHFQTQPIQFIASLQKDRKVMNRGSSSFFATIHFIFFEDYYIQEWGTGYPQKSIGLDILKSLAQ